MSKDILQNGGQHEPEQFGSPLFKVAAIAVLTAGLFCYLVVFENVFDFSFDNDPHLSFWHYDKIGLTAGIFLAAAIVVLLYYVANLKQESSQRAKLHQELVDKQRELESVVIERTAALVATNRELSLKVAETEKREEELRDSRQRYYHLISNSPVIMYTCEATGNYGTTFVSETIRDLLGYEPSEFVDNPDFWVNHIHPDDKTRVFTGLSGLFEHGWHSHEYRVLNKNGEYRWMHDELRLELDENGKPVELVGYWIDISNLKNTQTELVSARHKYEVLFNSVMEGIAIVDPDETVVLCNRSFAEIFGVNSVEEMVGKNLLELIPTEVHGKIHAESDRRMLGESSVYELDIVAADGRQKTILASIAPYFEDDIYRGTIGAIIDISSRKKAEQELAEANRELEFRVAQRTDALSRINESLEREAAKRLQVEESLKASEHRFREMAELLPEGVFEADEAFTLLFANKTLIRYFLCDGSHLSTECHLTRMAVETDSDKVSDFLKSLLTPRPQDMIEFTAHRMDGSTFEAMMKVSVSDESGELRIRGIITDLTMSKRRDAELQKAEKLESVGLLAGGLAHDFNNLLTGVLGNLSLALLDLPEGNDATTRVCDAEKAAVRAQELTRQLLTMSKGGDPVRKSASIEHILRDIVQFVLSGSTVRGDVSIAPDLNDVVVDSGQIGQVIHNLAINAVQAMPNGGSLFVGAVNASINKESALPLNSGNHVKIVIRDTGTGIQPQILSKIFDPYFTTKTTGSGLGLATSYSIIKNHGGHIEVESTVGVGTEFRIYLPSAGESSGSRRQHHETIRKGSGRILLMDDEQYIRDLTRSMLELMGYQVACSSNGNDAIRQYKKAHSEGKRFDAVILDLTVQGGLGGKDTLEQLRAIDPDVRAIVCSGYSNDCVMARYFEYGFKGLVTKPFRVEDLSTTIDHVLSDKSQPAVSIS